MAPAAVGNALIVFVVAAAAAVSKATCNPGVRAKPIKLSAMSATASKQLTFTSKENSRDFDTA